MASSKLQTAAQVSKQIMDAAIQAVKTEQLSERSAAEVYGVSRSTLRNRLRNRHTGHHGGQTKFPPRLEKELVDLLKACCAMGIPLNRYHAKTLMAEAPKKKRLEKNTMLRLKAGAMITSDEMVAEIEAESARKKAAKAAKPTNATKRKATEPEPALEPSGRKAPKAATKKPREK